MRHEWAETADDILWRRTKLGLRLTADEQAALARFVDAERRASAPNPKFAQLCHESDGELRVQKGALES